MLYETVRGLVARYGLAELLSRRVLIVDDEPDNLFVLKSFLETDYEVLDATDGAEALALAESHDVDVVITDQRMPGMTGVELLERLRLVRPDVAGIVLTAYTDTPALMSAINQARAFRYLKKPWQAEDLVAVVAQASEHVFQARAIARLVELLAARTEALGRALDDLRVAQQQMLHLERLSTMGRLAAGVTHDLRNAMTGLVMLQGQLQKRGIPDDAVRTLDVGVAGIRNLLGTLVTLNQFARDSRLTLSREPLDPADVVRDALSVGRFDLEVRDRRLEVALSDDLPQILGDRPKLVQVMVNLFRNAIQATGEGQRIAIEARAADGHVTLAVEDEGRGIDPAIAGRLFEPFVSTKRDEGMGMGLYMARLIVESHEGKISAANRPGGGARFELSLPIDRSEVTA